MVGSRALARLAEHAAETESKLVLVGDDHQLPEIDAGGGFRGLAERLGAVELRELRRQANDWDREALTDLRRGHGSTRGPTRTATTGASCRDRPPPRHALRWSTTGGSRPGPATTTA